MSNADSDLHAKEPASIDIRAAWQDIDGKFARAVMPGAGFSFKYRGTTLGPQFSSDWSRSASNKMIHATPRVLQQIMAQPSLRNAAISPRRNNKMGTNFKAYVLRIGCVGLVSAYVPILPIPALGADQSATLELSVIDEITKKPTPSRVELVGTQGNGYVAKNALPIDGDCNDRELPFDVTLERTVAQGKSLAILIAGRPSHEPGAHEHNAGVQLFAKALAQGAPQIDVRVHLNEDWPSAPELDRADTILLYCDAGGEALKRGDRLDVLTRQMNRGAGLIVLHYAVALEEVGPQALAWVGGFKERHWSVNPTWEAHYAILPTHPVTRGVKPFSSKDEWYYHMRFTQGPGILTLVLATVPPLESVDAGCCGYEGNPIVLEEVRTGKAQATAWAFERPNGGRAFGFTGGHFHRNWADENQRKLLLNAILWTAKLQVPLNGVESHLTPDDMIAHLDPKPALPH